MFILWKNAFVASLRVVSESTMSLACDGSKDNYGPKANLYASSRPSYPKSLVQDFVSSLPESCRNNALDIAAGSGQLSASLAEHFDNKIVALDKSEEQLKHGPRLPNIIYHPGLATDLSGANEQIGDTTHFDAVTCAQAYHWFIAENTDKAILQEVCRVIHPEHGRLGIFGYGVCTISSSPVLQDVFQKFYYDDLGSNLDPSSPDCYWDVDRRLLDGAIEDFPSHGLVETMRRHNVVEKRTMGVHEFLNYIRTFSGLLNLRKKAALQGKQDPMGKLQLDFEANSKEDQLLEVDFPFFLIVLKPAG